MLIAPGEGGMEEAILARQRQGGMVFLETQLGAYTIADAQVGRVVNRSHRMRILSAVAMAGIRSRIHVRQCMSFATSKGGCPRLILCLGRNLKRSMKEIAGPRLFCGRLYPSRVTVARTPPLQLARCFERVIAPWLTNTCCFQDGTLLNASTWASTMSAHSPAVYWGELFNVWALLWERVLAMFLHLMYYLLHPSSAHSRDHKRLCAAHYCAQPSVPGGRRGRRQYAPVDGPDRY
jgi:hypothetical protein